MGHGGNHHINPIIGNPLPPIISDGQKKEKPAPDTEEQNPKHLKANAAVVFDKKWQNSQAAERRSNLSALISNAENKLEREAEAVVRKPVENNSTLRTPSENAPANRGRNEGDLLPQKQNRSDSEIPRRNADNPTLFGGVAQQETKNLLSKSLNELINLAKEHPNFEKFAREPKSFWNDVKNMSAVRTVETYVNGKLEPRAASRYGDLLALLDKFVAKNGSNSGGVGKNLESFLNTLPRGEKNVFLARYQINRTFGANELFAGRGVLLDKNGRFPAQTFLSANGKNPQISANTVLSLLGGDASGKAAALLEENGFFSNYQFLFNPKSAAMLGLSLALCQNLNALLSLEELAPEAFQPKVLNELTVPQQSPHSLSKNTFDDNEIAANAAARRAAGEMFAAGAIINGALLTLEKYGKAKFETVGLSAELRADDGFRFAAGATGAMMGATIGCIAPLAEKSIGEILGFASSVVIGLTDAGLRTLGANALVSVITSGVQTFLNASGEREKISSGAAENKFLNAAESFENDARVDFFGSRRDVFAAS